MVVCQHQVRRNQIRPCRSASCLSVAKGAVLHEQRCPTRGRSFVRHCPQSQKCARRSCPLRWGHILITLLLHTFLPPHLGLLAGGKNCDKCGTPGEQCGAHQVAHVLPALDLSSPNAEGNISFQTAFPLFVEKHLCAPV